MFADDSPSALVAALQAANAKAPKNVKSTLHLYPPAPSESAQDGASASAPSPHRISSWKMNEFLYRQQPPPFPTLARGLFTEPVPYDRNSDETHRIVARGYEKFFNISELDYTQVSGRFVTVKSNA